MNRVGGARVREPKNIALLSGLFVALVGVGATGDYLYCKQMALSLSVLLIEMGDVWGGIRERESFALCFDRVSRCISETIHERKVFLCRDVVNQSSFVIS